MQDKPCVFTNPGYRRRSVWIPSIATLLLTGAMAAWGHHSFAMYDATHSIQVHGTVKEYRFGNPHTLIVLSVKNAAGEMRDFTIETNGSFYLERNEGWKRDSLALGDQVVALIRPLRDGSPGGDLLKVTRSDGHELIARPPPWPPEETK